MRYPYPENVYTYFGMCVCVSVCLFCLIPRVHVIVTRKKTPVYKLVFFTLSLMMNILIMYCTLLQIIPGVLKLASHR